jgi:hypothetical protein
LRLRVVVLIPAVCAVSVRKAQYAQYIRGLLGVEWKLHWLITQGLEKVSILRESRFALVCIRDFNRCSGGAIFAQLSGQFFASENKPLFGYISKGGYNAARLDGRGSLQKLRGRNQFATKVEENRTLGRLEQNPNRFTGCFRGFREK